MLITRCGTDACAPTFLFPPFILSSFLVSPFPSSPFLLAPFPLSSLFHSFRLSCSFPPSLLLSFAPPVYPSLSLFAPVRVSVLQPCSTAPATTMSSWPRGRPQGGPLHLEEGPPQAADRMTCRGGTA